MRWVSNFSRGDWYTDPGTEGPLVNSIGIAPLGKISKSAEFNFVGDAVIVLFVFVLYVKKIIDWVDDLREDGLGIWKGRSKRMDITT